MQVVIAMWEMMMSVGPENEFMWDELHDAGVAHLAFMESCLYEANWK